MPLLLIAAIAVKILPALLLRVNHTWREALAAGILMCPRLSLIIAAAAIGEKLGIIEESVNAGIVLVAIVTVTASPMAFLRVFPARPAHQRMRLRKSQPVSSRDDSPREVA